MQYRSWFRVLAIATPSALIAALAIAMFVARASVPDPGVRMEPRMADLGNGASVGLTGTSSLPIHTFRGVVTDDHCGARHDMHSGMSTSECTQACLRRGANYILVNGDKTYRLEGNADQLHAFSGTRVKLTGSLAGNRINVSSITWE